MATGTDKWVTVQVQLPEAITDIAQVLDDLVGALIVILDIVRAVLDVVKAFLIGLLDPIAAIIATIIAEIEGLLQDISQAGFYISGDLDISPPAKELLGGFAAYERRMITRLVDRSDPTRPNISSKSAVIAVFLYASFDLSTIAAALEFIDLLKKFFGIGGRTKAYTTPTGLKVAYGTSGMGVGAFGAIGQVLRKNQDANVASVRWKMAPPAGSGAVSWPLPAPAGFLVEVSTVPDGLTLAYQTYVKNAELDEDGEQHKVVGLVSGPDGKPFKLYGGAGILDVDVGLKWSVSGDTYTPPTGNGTKRLYLYRSATDNVGVPPNALMAISDIATAAFQNSPAATSEAEESAALDALTAAQDSGYVLQRTFFVDTFTVLGINVAAPGQPFSTILKYEDMPYGATFEDAGDGKVKVTVDAERAREVYVRVSAVTKDVTSSTSGSLASSFGWTVKQEDINNGASGAVKLRVIPSASAKGDPSAVLKVTFPSAQTQAYLDTVTTALVVMVLSRSDLVAQITAAGKEAAAAARAASDAATAAFQSAPPAATAEEEDAALSALVAIQAAATSAESAIASAFQLGTGGQETGLEDIASVLFPKLFGVNPGEFFKQVRSDPTHFRMKVLTQCRKIAEQAFIRVGVLPSSVEALVLGFTVDTVEGGEKALTDVTWADLGALSGLSTGVIGVDATLLDSLDVSDAGGLRGEGVAPNPFSVGVDPAYIESTTPLLDRAPGFTLPDGEDEFAKVGMGSADFSPVIYSRGTGAPILQFCRNVFLANPTILSVSAQVLNIAAGPLMYRQNPGEGRWLAYRLFPQGLPEVEAFLAEIVRFLDAIADGLKGVMDSILAYIDFINARILELEALLQRIASLLDFLLSIEVPAASGLVVVANGTDGVLQALVTAEDKPEDSGTVTTRIDAKGNTVYGGAYGCGVVLLAGGLPATLLELLQLMFVGEED